MYLQVHINADKYKHWSADGIIVWKQPVHIEYTIRHDDKGRNWDHKNYFLQYMFILHNLQWKTLNNNTLCNGQQNVQNKLIDFLKCISNPSICTFLSTQKKWSYKINFKAPRKWKDTSGSICLSWLTTWRRTPLLKLKYIHEEFCYYIFNMLHILSS